MPKASAPKLAPETRTVPIPDAWILRFLAERLKASEIAYTVFMGHFDVAAGDDMPREAAAEWEKRQQLFTSVVGMDRTWVKALLQAMRPDYDTVDYSPGHDHAHWADAGAIVGGNLYLYIHDMGDGPTEMDEAQDVLAIVPLDKVRNLSAKGGA